MESKYNFNTEYELLDLSSRVVFCDNGWSLDAPNPVKPTLIRTVYAQKQLCVKSGECGLFKFSDWLPVKRIVKGSSAPVTFKSEGLAKELGLNNLYITLNGYFPARDARMTTCSFKETEAYTVCARMSEDFGKVLVVASAGNTARAFAKVCSDNDIPLLLCVPEDNIDALWFDSPLNECVKLIVTESGSDYFDAISLGNAVVKSDKYIPEGGAKNVARRDGMATTMLSAATFIGAVPEFYFQAVGSGTGAIAAWEANLRLLEDGRFGSNKARLIVSQNYPFIPMYRAWEADSRDLLSYDDELARQHVEEIDAKVLSNRRPPYSMIGGLYDALKDTNGDICYVANDKAREASFLFERAEGVDIHPAASVAVASLQDKIADGTVSKDSVIMLNITGAGEKLFKKERELHYLKPSHIFAVRFTEQEVLDVVNKLF